MLVGRGGHVHRALNGRIARGPSDERLRVPGFFQLGDAGAPDVDGHIDITRYQGVCPRHLIHNRKYLELIDIRLSRLPVFRIARAHRAHPRSEFLDNERPGSDGLMEVVRLALANGKWERAERNGHEIGRAWGRARG